MCLQERAVIRDSHQLERAIFEAQHRKTPRDAGCSGQQARRQVSRHEFIQLLLQPIRRLFWNFKATLLECVKNSAGAEAEAKRIGPVNEWISRKQCVVSVRTYICENEASELM